MTIYLEIDDGKEITQIEQKTLTEAENAVTVLKIFGYKACIHVVDKKALI